MASSGATATLPSVPSTRTVSPSGMAVAPWQVTTAGMPSDLARMAVWLVGPPSSVMIAFTRSASRVAVSAGARSSATSTKGWPGSGTPGMGTPSRVATVRLRRSSRSATRSAM